MRLVVIGGTGRTGRRIVGEAVDRGHEVVMVGRSAESGPVADGAEAISADATDRADLERVVLRADAVITALSIPRASSSPFAAVTGRTDLHSHTAEMLVDAMERGACRRLVKISAQGVGDSAPRAGWGFRALVAVSNLGPAFADHALADARVQASSLDWTIVRPPILADGPVVGRVEAGEAVTTRTFTRLSRADLAKWVVDIVPDPAWFRRVVSIRPAPDGDVR